MRAKLASSNQQIDTNKLNVMCIDTGAVISVSSEEICITVSLTPLTPISNVMKRQPLAKHFILGDVLATTLWHDVVHESHKFSEVQT